MNLIPRISEESVLPISEGKKQNTLIQFVQLKIM